MFVAVIVRIRVRIKIGVIRIAYIPIFGIPCADIGGVDFLIEIPFRNDYISAYYIYFFTYIT